MRVPALVVVLLAASIAGCIGTDDAVTEDSLPDTPADPDELSREVVSVVDPDAGRGEPSLGVTSDGTLFTNAAPGTVYRSTDEGRNWTELGQPVSPVPDFDPDLVVDGDDRVWFDVLYLACNAVSVSEDKGETWSTPNPAACPAPGGDRQYVIATEDCEAFIYYHQIPTFYQMASRTTDCGQTWTPTGPVETPDHQLFVDEGSGWGGGGFWNQAEDSVHLTFSWFQDGAAGEGGWYPALARTADDGLNWDVVQVAEPEGEPIGLSLVVGDADQAGNVYIAWAELLDDGEVAVKLAASTDDGRTFQDPIRLDASNTSKVFPAITAGADGRVAVAWYEANQTGHPNQVSNATAWNVTTSLVTDATTDPTVQRAQLSPDVVREGPICPNGSTCSEDREFLDYFSLATMPDGRLAATYNSGQTSEDLANVFTLTEDPVLAEDGPGLD